MNKLLILGAIVAFLAGCNSDNSPEFCTNFMDQISTSNTPAGRVADAFWESDEEKFQKEQRKFLAEQRKAQQQKIQMDKEAHQLDMEIRKKNLEIAKIKTMLAENGIQTKDDYTSVNNDLYSKAHKDNSSSSEYNKTLKDYNDYVKAKKQDTDAWGRKQETWVETGATQYIQPNAYGLGVHSDQYGRAVKVVPERNK